MWRWFKKPEVPPPVQLFRCAKCGRFALEEMEGVIIKGGDFYLGALPYVCICLECSGERMRIQRERYEKKLAEKGKHEH